MHCRSLRASAGFSRFEISKPPPPPRPTDPAPTSVCISSTLDNAAVQDQNMGLREQKVDIQFCQPLLQILLHQEKNRYDCSCLLMYFIAPIREHAISYRYTVDDSAPFILQDCTWRTANTFCTVCTTFMNNPVNEASVVLSGVLSLACGKQAVTLWSRT